MAPRENLHPIIIVIFLLFILGTGILFIIPHLLPQSANPNIVSSEKAYNQAVTWLRIETLRSPILKSDTRWLSSEIDPEPQIVFDLSGNPLWYIFSIVENSKNVGTITISGQKTLGGPLYGFNPNRNSLIENDRLVPARNILMQDFPGDDVRLLRYVWDDSSGLLIEGFLLNVSSGQTYQVFLKAYELSAFYPNSPDGVGIRNYSGSLYTLTETQRQAMIMQWNEGERSSNALQVFARESGIDLFTPITSYQAFKIQEFLIENSIDTPKRFPPQVPFVLISPQQTGRPCKSNDEWHQKADQIGSWVDGFLVNESVSDTEIMSFLIHHNISSSITMSSSTPHHIGYYLAVPDSQYQSIRDSIENDKLRWNMSFSSARYVFVQPSVKKTGEIIQTPVFIFNSGAMNHSENFDDIVHRNIPIQKTKIVTFDLSQLYSPIYREKKLEEFNDDNRILFVFKEYLEGDIC